MARKSAVLVLVMTTCLPMSCRIFDGDDVCIEAPPEGNGVEAVEWWDRKVEQWPLDFLAVYAEVSEAHRRQGTSATYVDWFQGRIMTGWYRHETRLPAPLPEHALARIKERLKGYKPPKGSAPSDPPRFGGIMAAESRGCTEDRAREMWKEAEAKVRRR